MTVDEQLRQLIREEVRAELAPILERLDRLAARMPAPSERLDVAGLALMMMKTPAAVRQLLHRRRDLPRIHIGRRVVFDRTAVERWMQDNDRAP